MTSYGVAMGTASAALGKLASCGLIRTVPGSGTYAVRPNPSEPNPVLDLFAAASLCRTLATHTLAPDSPRVLEIRVGEHGDTSGDRECPPTRLVDVSALEGLDKHVLRWMSEALLAAARRMVAGGPCEGDTHVIATAQAILRDGGRRPEDQFGTSVLCGPRHADEDVLCAWPELAASTDTSTPDPVLHGGWPQRMTWARAEKATRIAVNSVIFRASGQNLTAAGTYIEMASRLLEPTLVITVGRRTLHYYSHGL